MKKLVSKNIEKAVETYLIINSKKRELFLYYNIVLALSRLTINDMRQPMRNNIIIR